MKLEKQLLRLILKVKLMTKKKCFFLDRDGVINKDLGYIYKKSDFKIYSTTGEAIEYLNQKKFIVIVVTNQSGIGRKLFTVRQLKKLHTHMKNMIAKKKGKIHDIFFCPYHPTEAFGKYKKNSKDRKPNNGMLEKAIKKWNISRSNSFMIGDKKIDHLCAKKSKIKFYYKEKINLFRQVKKILKDG